MKFFLVEVRPKKGFVVIARDETNLLAVRFVGDFQA